MQQATIFAVNIDAWRCITLRLILYICLFFNMITVPLWDLQPFLFTTKMNPVTSWADTISHDFMIITDYKDKLWNIFVLRHLDYSFIHVLACHCNRTLYTFWFQCNQVLNNLWGITNKFGGGLSNTGPEAMAFRFWVCQEVQMYTRENIKSPTFSFGVTELITCL